MIVFPSPDDSCIGGDVNEITAENTSSTFLQCFLLEQFFPGFSKLVCAEYNGNAILPEGLVCVPNPWHDVIRALIRSPSFKSSPFIFKLKINALNRFMLPTRSTGSSHKH